MDFTKYLDQDHIRAQAIAAATQQLEAKRQELADKELEFKESVADLNRAIVEIENDINAMTPTEEIVIEEANTDAEVQG